MTNIPEQQKIIQYLNEAQATELALIRTLQAHIAVTPSGSYRRGLERHLAETQEHAERVQRRLGDLGVGRSPVQLGVGVVQGVLGQVLALSRSPLELVRGGSPEERLLKNAKDECATEGLEIATYEALEQLARRVGDEETAELAADIRADEEKMLANLRKELPKLVDAVVKAEIDGDSTYDPTATGAADAVKDAQETVKQTAKRAGQRARTSARQARRVPGVAQVEGEVKGAVASEEDLAIDGYDSLKVNEINSKLAELSQIDLAKIDAYERKTRNRSSILNRITSLRGDEPWPGYDEQTVDEIRQALDAADDDRLKQVREYESRHKKRQGVLEATERELAKS